MKTEQIRLVLAIAREKSINKADNFPVIFSNKT